MTGGTVNSLTLLGIGAFVGTFIVLAVAFDSAQRPPQLGRVIGPGVATQ